MFFYIVWIKEIQKVWNALKNRLDFYLFAHLKCFYFLISIIIMIFTLVCIEKDFFAGEQFPGLSVKVNRSTQVLLSLIRTNYFNNYLRFYALKLKPNIKSTFTISRKFNLISSITLFYKQLGQMRISLST